MSAVPTKAGDIGFLGAAVIGCCEHLEVGAKNSVLCKSNGCFLLRSLLSTSSSYILNTVFKCLHAYVIKTVCNTYTFTFILKTTEGLLWWALIETLF